MRRVLSIDLDSRRSLPGWDESVIQEPEWFTEPVAIRYVMACFYYELEKEGCCWVSAATLIAPDGQTILLAGPSHAGKTTLTSALALTEHWVVVSEDVTMVDATGRWLIPIASALNWRPHTLDLLRTSTGVQRLELLDEQYWYDKEKFATAPVSIPVDVFVYLDVIEDVTNPGPFMVTQSTPVEMVHRFIRMSNAVRLEGGVGMLENLVQDSETYCLSGGTLSERMAFFHAFVEKNQSQKFL